MVKKPIFNGQNLNLGFIKIKPFKPNTRKNVKVEWLHFENEENFLSLSFFDFSAVYIKHNSI